MSFGLIMYLLFGFVAATLTTIFEAKRANGYETGELTKKFT